MFGMCAMTRECYYMCFVIDPRVRSPKDFHLQNNGILQSRVLSSPHFPFSDLFDNLGDHIGNQTFSFPLESEFEFLRCLTMPGLSKAIQRTCAPACTCQGYGGIKFEFHLFH